MDLPRLGSRLAPLLALVLSLTLVLSSCTPLRGGRGSGSGDDDDDSADDDDATGDDDDATGDDDDATGDDDDDDDDDDDGTPPPTLLTVDEILTCGETRNDTTVGQPSEVEGWQACEDKGGTGWTGGELVYEFIEVTTEPITVTLAWQDSGEDLDLFVIDGLDSSNSTCAGTSLETEPLETVTFSQGSSSWYVVVDGWAGGEAPFTIVASCGAK